MTNFGKWIKLLPDLKVAVGITLLVVTTAFSIGLGASGLITNVKSVPARLDTLENSAVSLDSTLNVLQTSVLNHIQQDSIATWRIYCVVNSIADKVDIGPLDCDRILGGGS